eukprot:172128_1
MAQMIEKQHMSIPDVLDKITNGKDKCTTLVISKRWIGLLVELINFGLVQLHPTRIQVQDDKWICFETAVQLDKNHWIDSEILAKDNMFHSSKCGPTLTVSNIAAFSKRYDIATVWVLVYKRRNSSWCIRSMVDWEKYFPQYPSVPWSVQAVFATKSVIHKNKERAREFSKYVKFAQEKGVWTGINLVVDDESDANDEQIPDNEETKSPI